MNQLRHMVGKTVASIERGLTEDCNGRPCRCLSRIHFTDGSFISFTAHESENGGPYTSGHYRSLGWLEKKRKANA